ncbi:MAG: hypothetical protein NTX92_07415 [Euryarchaeota archaeon]|jgi:hypothetical protein|nr:hypothetical protein [Euryarchaeota archaeon]
MREKYVIIGIIVLLVSVGLCGCTNPLSDKDKFVGAWSGTYSYGGIGGLSVSITFLSDGTYTASLPLSTESGTWDIKDGKLLKQGGTNPMVAYTYSFTTNDKSLILSSTTQNEQWVLTKQ